MQTDQVTPMSAAPTPQPRPARPAPPTRPPAAPDLGETGHAHRHAGDPVFELHRGGKMHISPNVPLRGAEDLSMAYTPGVARVCQEIAAHPEAARDYTWVSNTVAVVTDGTAVLG